MILQSKLILDFGMQHAYSDGHVDEVVVRNLGSQEGETVIADSIR